MATLVKQHGRYALQFYDPERQPQRKRVALKTGDKRTAQRKRSELENDHVLGIYDPWIDDPFNYKEEQRKVKPLSIGETLTEFLDTKRRTGRSETTLRTYYHIVGLFARTIGEDTPLTAVTTQSLARYVRDDSISPSTQYTRFRHLKAFFSWCVEQRLVRRSPLASVEAPDNTHRLPKVMDEDDLESVCEAVRADYETKLRAGRCREGEMIWQVTLYRFAFYTGLRASELGRLKWKHIDRERGLVYIIRQKNKKQQTIPLNCKAAEVLGGISTGKPEDYVFISPQQQSQTRNIRHFVEHVSLSFRRARKLAGNRPISFHSLRHGFCTRLAQAGKNAAVIQKAARHSNIQITMRYVDLSNKHLKAELDDVFA